MRLLNTHFDPDLPYWRDYLPWLSQLAGHEFPGCDQLNRLLPGGLVSAAGQHIRFVPSTRLDDEAYELRVHESGQVSTRPDNWHDLFNALVWMRYPRIKTAMNKLHYGAWSEQGNGRRGPLRDALTLFDECGVIVYSDQPELLVSVAERRWKDVFLNTDFNTRVQLSVCGHAMLEKFLSPYRSMTAKALLVQVEPELLKRPREEVLNLLDQVVARRMLDGEVLTRPACLAPLPLAGVPGWWPLEQQADITFYADLDVFRPPPRGLLAAPVIQV